MKKRILSIMFITAVCGLFASCQKEENEGDALLLFAEGYKSDSKVTYDGNHTYWESSGECVQVNGVVYTVNNNGSQATISHNNMTPPFYGVYPAKLNPEHDYENIYSSNSGSNYTLNISHLYEYIYSSAGWTIKTPMVAYTAEGNKLFFKHVTAAVMVEVTNNSLFPMRVTQVDVESNKYKLNGTVVVDLTNIDNISPVTTSTASEKKVVLSLSRSSFVIPAGETAQLQVPVLPVGDDNRFTITVNAVMAHNNSVKETVTKTQGNSQAHYALGRGEIGYAPITVGSKHPFTVDASGHQVLFSYGNLRARTTNYGSSWTWSFSTRQYDTIGRTDGNICINGNGTISNQTGYVNMFGWSTSSTHYGINNSLDANDYIGDLVDWGTTMGDGWRTLTADEWLYIFHSRTGCSTVSGVANARFVKGIVNGASGVIVFPDVYEQPEDVTLDGNDINQSYNYQCPGAAYLTDAQWHKMESAGAIFLPMNGRREGTNIINHAPRAWMRGGYYWTSSTGTYPIEFRHRDVQNAEGIDTYERYDSKKYGHYVRLVKNYGNW